MTISRRLALMTLVATLAYLGVAILGLGGLSAFFSRPTLVVLSIALMPCRVQRS